MLHERSLCPVNMAVEVVGDRWSLVVLRDVMFMNRRYFRELLERSDEGISSNILASRLQNLVDRGLLWRAEDPTHKQKVVYSLTEAGIQLLPVIVMLGAWGAEHTEATAPTTEWFTLLRDEGPTVWDGLMAELRIHHLSGAGGDPRGEPTFARLGKVYGARLAARDNAARRAAGVRKRGVPGS
ncbi:MAG: winged helix-turn-helix transcriptional regulator [Acidimicrobiales bacterium]